MATGAKYQRYVGQRCSNDGICDGQVRESGNPGYAQCGSCGTIYIEVSAPKHPQEEKEAPVAKGKMYEVVILMHSKEGDKGNPDKTKIIAGPTNIVAESDREARMAATLMIPKEVQSALDQVEVKIRLFQSTVSGLDNS